MKAKLEEVERFIKLNVCDVAAEKVMHEDAAPKWIGTRWVVTQKHTRGTARLLGQDFAHNQTQSQLFAGTPGHEIPFIRRSDTSDWTESEEHRQHGRENRFILWAGASKDLHSDSR